MNSRDLFHAACALEKTTRPPLWMMRQAGRYLPEYKQLKAEHGFLKIVKTPELSLEAALQPMRRFDFDCSILFSDILVVSEALGLPYYFKDEGGIALENTIKSDSDIEKLLDKTAIREKLNYVTSALKMLRKALPNKAVIGFCAAPFTLAAYMIEGGSSLDFPKFRTFIKDSPESFDNLMTKLTEALCEYALMQVECGIDAFQIFDSHAALTAKETYPELSGKYLCDIIKALEGRSRTIVFANGMSVDRFGEVAPMGADVYSIEAGVQLSQLKQTWLAPYAVQGNLDPELLSKGTAKEVADEAKKIIADMSEVGGHIFNLGHGIKPDAKIENVEALCETVKNYKQ